MCEPARFPIPCYPKLLATPTTIVLVRGLVWACSFLLTSKATMFQLYISYMMPSVKSCNESLLSTVPSSFSRNILYKECRQCQRQQRRFRTDRRNCFCTYLYLLLIYQTIAYCANSSPAIFYQADTSLDAQAEEFGRHARSLLKAGSGSPEQHSYVNYAHGDESLEEVYGYKPWRLQKLRWLKKKYDPKNKFGFFEPIV
jgi:Berberine and berberine like